MNGWMTVYFIFSVDQSKKLSMLLIYVSQHEISRCQCIYTLHKHTQNNFHSINSKTDYALSVAEFCIRV